MIQNITEADSAETENYSNTKTSAVSTWLQMHSQSDRKDLHQKWLARQRRPFTVVGDREANDQESTFEITLI